MKFKSIRLGKLGISFDYHGDKLTWIWPWAVVAMSSKYYSDNYKFYTDSIKGYWVYLVQRSIEEHTTPAKVKGYYWPEIMTEWVAHNLRFGFYVVLHDIDLQNKSNVFWNKIPDAEKIELRKDIVVLRCQDMKEVIHICNSMSSDFATVEGVGHGKILYWNENHRKLETSAPLIFKDGRTE